MAKIVEADMRQVSLLQDQFEIPSKVAGIDRCSDAGMEYDTGLFPPFSRKYPLLMLQFFLSMQLIEGYFT